MSVNVISLFNICVKREIREWQIVPFIVIFSEELTNFSVISGKIAEFRLIVREWEITT